MATFVAEGSPRTLITAERLQRLIARVLHSLADTSRVLVLPPDMTRAHSGAGIITQTLFELAGGVEVFHVLPALGTHEPMSESEIRSMYGERIPLGAFKQHNWRQGLHRFGKVPAEFAHDVSEGVLRAIMPDFGIPVEINDLIVNGGYTAVISVGQVVPHEVTGMANGVKNVLIGAGGYETLNKTHFLGAAYGMERMMGRIDTPVRKVLNRAHNEYLAQLGIVYILTVMARNGSGETEMRGFFAGDDLATFEQAAALSQKVNINLLDEPLREAVVYLDPASFRSTWLGNKAIYRTRMAMADGGELLVIAPGVDKFGEDSEIDAIIRKYGYCGTPATLRAVRENEDIRAYLSAAAHLIHGSSEGRFKITYATTPSLLTRDEVESVGFQWMDVAQALQCYKPTEMRNGYNEGVYYVRDPGMGLWALKKQFAG